MSDLINRSEDWLGYHKGAPWETDAMKLIAELAKQVKELEQQLAQAHRQGWEQAKKEAFEIVRTTQIGYIQTTIAAMEYKEKAND